MIDREKVLEFLRARGPCIPRDIMKVMGADTVIIGAVLSQLKDSGHVRISNTKVGGSPLYYLPAHEGRLDGFIKHLHDQEKKACEFLKQNGILRDDELEPVARVALREAKDFAKPVEVNTKDEKILFWRWFMLPNDSVETRIRDLLKKTDAPKEAPPLVQEEPVKEAVQPALKVEPPTPVEPQPAEKMPDDEPPIPKKQMPEKAEQKHISAPEPTGDSFYTRLKKHFQKNDIEILETEVIKKGKEIDFIIMLPSAAGKLKFYCKAKDKKRNNEGDLSTAYVKGENKKLPVLFLTTGELTKKTKELLQSDFRNITVNRL